MVLEDSSPLDMPMYICAAQLWSDLASEAGGFNYHWKELSQGSAAPVRVMATDADRLIQTSLVP